MFGRVFNSVDPVVSLVMASRARKQRAEKWLRYYHDQQSDETLRLIGQKWSKPEAFRLFQVNIVKKTINKRANLYRLAPRRIFTGLDQEAGDALYRAMNADVVLKRASRLVKLLKTGALQVGWSATGPTLHVVTPNVLDAIAPDPEFPNRLIITHNAEREIDRTFSDWTATTYQRRDYRGAPLAISGNPGNVNPYGVLPFVALFDRHPDDCFFLPGGDDLIEAQEAINVALTNLWRAVELQAHGQAWATGLPAGEAVRIGPERAITLPDGGKFGFAAPNAPISDILEAIQFVMRQTAAANDLSADVFDLDRASESGAAKHVEQIDLKEARLDDIALWRTFEARLWNVIKAVVNTHRPGTIPADATMTVDFAELQENVSETERLTNARTRIELGAWSPVDLLRAENPDGFPTREDALAELMKRKAETETLRPTPAVAVPAPVEPVAADTDTQENDDDHAAE
ncbi:hypothetical protein [Azospirillum sp. SYSU D00513]|uniref:hypothetical protein n=1 Tax=Azospirillum sp. SYSU D00513 TaxID=2812561 RepID=UPI001A976693|nr:hypothetical protein [Azospirillum sp. SYSU D00513]